MRPHEDDFAIPGSRAGLILRTWGMVAGAVVGGVVSFAGQKSSNKANAKAAKNQGYVDTTTTRKEDPRATGYLDAGAQAASDALFGRPSGVAGDPRAGGGGSPRPAAPPGMRYNAKGKLVKPKNPGAAGGGVAAGPAAPAFNGQSQETADLVDRMANLPADNADLYDAGEEYVKGSLRGEETNPLIGRASNAADDIAEDPRLAAFQDALLADLGIGEGTGGSRRGAGSGGQGGANVRYGYAQNSSGGLPPANVPGGATATGADAALKKLIAGELPEGWQGAEDAIARRVGEERAANIRELRARAVGSGFYGGDVYKDLESGAIAKGDQALADELAAARYDAFANALGLGTQYDLGMADIAAGERAAGASAGASAAATQAALASQEKMAKYGFAMDALDLGERGRFGRAGALGDLAGLVSGDQRTALAGVTDIGGARRGDLGAAGELSLGADANRNAFRASENSLAGVRAGVNLGRQQLAFDRDQFYDPLRRTAVYTDIIGSIYGGLGSETTSGRDTRSSVPPAYSSPWGAALTGAAVGGQIGSSYRRQPSGATGGW